MREALDSVTILYVDEAPHQSTMGLEAEASCLDVVTAATAREGVEILAERPIDCIVSEYDLANVDGLAFLDAVRENDDEIPFILFAENGSEAIASAAISSGVTDYIPNEPGTDQSALLATRILSAVESTSGRIASDRRSQLEASRLARDEIIRSANVWINVLDESGNVVVWNETAEAISGYASEEVIGHNRIWEWLYPDRAYREDILEQVDDILRSETNVAEFDTTIRTKSGDDRIISWYSYALTDPATALNGSVAIGRDVTQQRETSRRLETLIENLPGIVYRSGPGSDWPFEFAAGECESLTGYTASELCTEVTWGVDIVHPDDHERIANAVSDAIDESEPFTLTYRILTRDGDERWVWERGQQTDTDALDGFIIDITEQKDREHALEQQNERLEKFASIVSHDLRNPLNVARGRLELARVERDDEHLDEVERAHDRMARLIDDILSLARGGERARDRDVVDLAELSESSWETVETGDARLITDIDRSVRAAQNRLKRLLENLFRNAVEHGGDDVTVTVGELPNRTGFYVEDDGPGISAKDREAVFESGYSTSTDGTGFGLAIVDEIAAAHDWTVTVTDGDRGGARFEITDVSFLE
ncbi:PAS domain S-box protein [Natrarchaeobius halalkaliphilus]|uniref:histidine kinase n=1 Tax=Natrarchaeobius halalkaliphilus TaxID=1679091 RepID=A0A3N6LPL5_9EURY|nr:PAS domain S-box protein [Natrarchaeobius halalkaliphilus]RQG88814.1 PAS domain S-box protein [Natrarchaeobius halalkaliphilus]